MVIKGAIAACCDSVSTHEMRVEAAPGGEVRLPRAASTVGADQQVPEMITT